MHDQRDLFNNEPVDQPRNIDASRQTCGTPVEETKTQPGEPTRSKSPKRKSPYEAVHLTVKEVADWYGVSVASIWRYNKNLPGFPRGHKLSAGSTRWFRSELEAFDERFRSAKS